LPEMIKYVARRQNGDPACRQLDAQRQAMELLTNLAQGLTALRSLAGSA
jgi:hypothetical protein